MKYIDGMYFKNADEASEWLAFDSGPDTQEQAYYAENDKYMEWEKWFDDRVDRVQL
jgi:hypothetical protein